MQSKAFVQIYETGVQTTIKRRSGPRLTLFSEVNPLKAALIGIAKNEDLRYGAIVGVHHLCSARGQQEKAQHES
ncbi:unnamed protein product [Hermetia illucens]|uniref:Uncharacterized protein n=1 Tax=Hermetia illucens TaxID=343691 RepID=A0A7R8YUR3_HERIL|nr:unnamed protein product [Hermetia illucens]